MWPLMIGFQMVKTVLLVLFLPSIIGSVGKIVGKGLLYMWHINIQFLSFKKYFHILGLPTLSGFAHPAETVDDLEFKDNSFNGDQLEKQTPYNGYQYNPQGDFLLE